MSNERVLPYLSHFKVSKVGMESSNQIAPLFRQLSSWGCDVVVSHPKKTRYIAEAKIKSDRVDSKTIAELVQVRRFAFGLLSNWRNRRIGLSRTLHSKKIFPVKLHRR